MVVATVVRVGHTGHGVDDLRVRNPRLQFDVVAVLRDERGTSRSRLHYDYGTVIFAAGTKRLGSAVREQGDRIADAIGLADFLDPGRSRARKPDVEAWRSRKIEGSLVR
jgi:hypothetical protein